MKDADESGGESPDLAACQRVAEWLKESRRAVAFTGAGISTESGIPDFRSPGGIWSQSQPVYFQDFLASAEARQEYWRQKAITHEMFLSSRPNQGHEILARWEADGRLTAVITQNIDGLHHDAGSRSILELHGTARRVACLECSASFDADAMVREFTSLGRPPDCPACNGLLKHAVISFGQSLDSDVLDRAVDLAVQADLFFAIGSSLVVEPAASLPRVACLRGAKLVIINRDPTGQDDSADVVLHASIGTALKAIDGYL